MIALRAATRPEARVAKRALVLNDRTIGLLAEILQMGRKRNDLVGDLNVLEAASTLFHVTQGARLPWANGLVSADVCQRQILAGETQADRMMRDPIEIGDPGIGFRDLPGIVDGEAVTRGQTRFGNGYRHLEMSTETGLKKLGNLR